LLHKHTTNSTKTTGRKSCQVVTTTHGETTATATTKATKNLKRQIEEPNNEVDEPEYDNNVDERKLPATIHNNNEEEEEDDEDNNDNDDDNDDDSPRQSLPNQTHNDLDVPSRKRNQTPIGNDFGGELATSQATEHLVSPKNWNSSCHHDHQKYDCHKYDADLPVSKLDRFTTGACVHKCINKKLFLCC